MHGFVLTRAEPVTVDVPGAASTALAAIPSGNGEIVAAYNPPGSTTSHTALIQEAKIANWDYPGSTSSLGNGINDAGQVVGNYTIAGVTHGFVLTQGQTASIDFPTASFTGAYGISATGDIVGRYRDAAGVTHGFTYSGGAYTAIDIPGATCNRY